MLLSRGVIVRAVIGTALLVGMIMLIPLIQEQSPSSLRQQHRSLQVSSQHQASYQVNAGQLSPPQTSLLKAQQNTAPGIPQSSPQASLWNTQEGGGGSFGSSSTWQQGTQQQTPQQQTLQQQIPQQQLSKQTSMSRSENIPQNGNYFQPVASVPAQNQNQQQRQQSQPLFSRQQQQQPIGSLHQQSFTGSVFPQQSHFQQQQQAPEVVSLQSSSSMQHDTMNNIGQRQGLLQNTAPESQGTMRQQQPPEGQVPQQAPLQQPQPQLRSSKEDSQLGVSVPDQNPDCEVPNAAEVAVTNPVWAASYPGSGAKLTWKLIRAITGIFTSDDHDHNGRVAKRMVVAVKTHFPSHTPAEVFEKDDLKRISRAVLLTRNPINSIPSYHNFVYEVQNSLLNHSTRAPIEAWIKWRNALFEQELQAWIDHQKYWLDNYNDLHLISMEHLTSDDRGPATIQRLGQFLASGGNDISDAMVPYDRMPCIWEMFVHGKVPGERVRRHSHRSGGPKTYPFTEAQMEQMISAIAQFKNEYGPNHPDLAMILDEYIVTIQEHKGKLEQM
jgi:hypothetical protein